MKKTAHLCRATFPTLLTIKECRNGAWKKQHCAAYRAIFPTFWTIKVCMIDAARGSVQSIAETECFPFRQQQTETEMPFGLDMKEEEVAGNGRGWCFFPMGNQKGTLFLQSTRRWGHRNEVTLDRFLSLFLFFLLFFTFAFFLPSSRVLFFFFYFFF